MLDLSEGAVVRAAVLRDGARDEERRERGGRLAEAEGEEAPVLCPFPLPEVEIEGVLWHKSALVNDSREAILSRGPFWPKLNCGNAGESRSRRKRIVHESLFVPQQPPISAAGSISE